MSIFDLYSKRQKRNRGEIPDVYQYKSLPPEFRVQVVHILRDALGEHRPFDNTVTGIFRLIHDTLCREYGWFVLTEDAMNNNFIAAVYNFFLKTDDIEKALDVIELTFKGVDTGAREYNYRYHAKPQIEPDQAIAELNMRFQEHGIGYQFESGGIIRIDSKFLHSEAVRPTLQILDNKKYQGANNEFLQAHEHYRHQRYKECLNECLKSLESTLKTVCKNHHWQYSEADTAKKLLEICFQNNLIPAYLQAHFSSLRAGLESGVPTLRNKLSGHGQGSQQTNVPSYIASYMINLTATSILLIAEAEKELP